MAKMLLDLKINHKVTCCQNYNNNNRKNNQWTRVKKNSPS